MKVMVATSMGQGLRKSDFFWATEREMVYFGSQCDNGHNDDPDGPCGCQRAFSGMDSRKATTTAAVIECEGNVKLFTEAYIESMKRAGWTFTKRECVQKAAQLLRMAASFPAGAILEKRGIEVRVRAQVGPHSITGRTSAL